MRLLFTFAGGSGHLEPLIPLARAAAAAGHTIAFSGRPWMAPKVEALGFRAFAAGSDVGLTPRRRPLAPVDLEREIRAIGPGFGLRIARERAADLLPLCREWKPDVLVCEETDFGAMLVGERLAIPHATLLVIASGAMLRPALVAPSLDVVRAEHGLAPDPALAMPARHLVLSPFPPGFRDPAFPLPPTAHALRPLVRESPEEEAASREWLDRLAPPLVYLTLGTVFNVESGDLFARALDGLRRLPISVVVTVGSDVDPAELGPQPAHVRAVRFVPQAALLPRCQAVVSHGGSGSVMGALAHGLPMLLLPMGADQPLNAARCEALGVARVLDALRATPEAIGAAAGELLGASSQRRAAQRVRDEIAALPGPAHAVALLERLAARS